MSLEKAIKSGEEHRKPYYRSKAIDPACRSHGGCSWCEGGRKHKCKIAKVFFREALKEVPGGY